MSAHGGPRIRMRDTERRPEQDALTTMSRAAALIFVLLTPLTAVLVFVFAVLLSRIKKVRPWWFLLAGLILFVISFVAGGFRAYFTIYRELFALVANGSGLSSIGTEVAEYLGSEWSRLLLTQVWLGVPLALIIASIIILARGRYAAKWRDRGEDSLKPQQQISRALKKAPEWPQKDVHSLDDLLVRLGVNEHDGRPWDISLAALRHHVFVCGPSGFGKTTTIIEVLRGLTQAPAAARFRIGTVFITMKPDPDMTDALRALAELSGRRFHHVTHDGTGVTYNPLRHGTAAQRRNILIEAEANAANGGFSEPHYRITGSRFTLLALRALEQACELRESYSFGGHRRNWTMDIHDLTRMMRPSFLEHMADVGEDEGLKADIRDYFQEMQDDPSVAGGVGGMRARFSNIAEGAAGATLREDTAGLDLREAIQNGDVVVFDLDAATDMEAAQYVANLAVADWTAAISELGQAKWHGDPSDPQRMNLLVVDEFSGLGGAGLKNALARSRSQGGSVMLSTQSYGELAETSVKGFRASLITNTSVKLLHRIEDEAEELAQLAGTRKAMKETTQTFEDRDLLGSQTRASGQGSLREVDEFKIHPNVLKDLEPGEIVALIRKPKEYARVMVRRTPPHALVSTLEAAKTTNEETRPATEDHDSAVAGKTQAREGQKQSAWTAAAIQARTPSQAKAQDDPRAPAVSMGGEDEGSDAMDMPIRE